MRSFIPGLILAAATVGSAAGVLAQEVLRKIDPSQPVGAIVNDTAPRPAAVISPQENDRRIVRWLTIDNRGVVDCARFAAEHATDAGVKQFAADVARQHESFLTTFGNSKDADAAGQTRSAPSPTSTPEQTAALLRDDGAGRAGALIYRPTDFVDVKEKICDSMQDFAKKQMEALPPEEFDHVFLTHLKFGHHALIASIDALDDTASAELKPQLDQMREMAEGHLSRAGEFQKPKNVDTTAARPGDAEVK